MKEFGPATKRVEVSVGESVRILRELQELSQSQLSELTSISAIDNGRVSECGARKSSCPCAPVPSCRTGISGLGSAA